MTFQLLARGARRAPEEPGEEREPFRRGAGALFDEELEALGRGYERARLMAKDAPYSRALFKQQLARGAFDQFRKPVISARWDQCAGYD